MYHINVWIACVLSSGKWSQTNMALTQQAHTTAIQTCSLSVLTSTSMKLQV